MSASTYEGLVRHINAQLRAGLRQEVAPLATDIVHRHAAAATGHAARQRGGLADRQRIKAEVNGITLSVYHTAKPGKSFFRAPNKPYELYDDPFSTLFSQWVNEGSWMDLGHYLKTSEKHKRDARPFMDGAAQELERRGGEIAGLLSRHLA